MAFVLHHNNLFCQHDVNLNVRQHIPVYFGVLWGGYKPRYKSPVSKLLSSKPARDSFKHCTVIFSALNARPS